MSQSRGRKYLVLLVLWLEHRIGLCWWWWRENRITETETILIRIDQHPVSSRKSVRDNRNDPSCSGFLWQINTPLGFISNHGWYTMIMTMNIFNCTFQPLGRVGSSVLLFRTILSGVLITRIFIGSFSRRKKIGLPFAMSQMTETVADRLTGVADFTTEAVGSIITLHHIGLLLFDRNISFLAERVAKASGTVHPTAATDPIADPVTTVDLNNQQHEDSIEK